MKGIGKAVLAGVALAGVLSGCGGNSASKISSCIEAGAKQLRSGSSRELTISCQPEKRIPYMFIVYPDVRSAQDTDLLKQNIDKAMALGPGGAGLSPVLEGFAGTLVVWQRGSMVKFDNGFRKVAQARQVFVVEKPDGAATTVTLKKEGLDVFITGLF